MCCGSNNNIAGQMGRRCRCRCNGNVSPDSGRRRFNCDFVYDCLYDLLEDETGNRNRNRCLWVYECLYDLLADAIEDDNNNCRCPR